MGFVKLIRGATPCGKMDYQMDYQCLPTGDSTLFVAEMRTSCKQSESEYY
jgi:hypothetical protein